MALFGRMTTSRKHMTSGRYGVSAEHPKGHLVEVFTSNDLRYVGVWGMHSEGREYGYDGPTLFDVREADLPWFSEDDLNEALEIANRAMEAAGLVQADKPKLDSNTPIVYDLEPGMVWRKETGKRSGSTIWRVKSTDRAGSRDLPTSGARNQTHRRG